MCCKSYLLKIDKSHLNKKVAKQLNLLFLESKWFVNHAIAQGVFDVDYKTKTVLVKKGEGFEERKIQVLSSQMKQALLENLKKDIKALSIKKKNGHKVGMLKFKKFIRAIPLKQFKVTYSLCGKNHICIQNIGKKLRVRGLKQIPEGVEFANAYLIQECRDYYLRVVTYCLPDKNQQTEDKAVGIDFGVRNQLTLSNGISIQYRVPITKKLKKLYQKLSKKQKNSNNRYKARVKVQKEFCRLNRIKDDIKNKIVSCIKNNYSIVCYQNDSIKLWQTWWGRKTFETALGEIKNILKERISTPIALKREFPSTRRCFCGTENQIQLDEEIYSCINCGLRMHRDLKASISILLEGLNQLPTERREAALQYAERKACGEESSTLSMFEYLNSIPHVRARLLVETGSLSALA